MSTQTAPDRYLEHDGARLRWRIQGSGPALVLLHGWALDLEYWQPVVATLAAHFTVLRFDRRGFGLSEGAPDIHRNVDDLLALLDAAQLQRVILVGMSQGARLAIHFACRHPARVRGLLLDGAPAFDSEPELPMDRYRKLLETEGLAAMRAEIAAHPLMQLQRADAGTRSLLQGMLARYRGLDLLRPARRAPAPDLGALHVPTLVLGGGHDSPARQEAGRTLGAAIPGARREQLAAAGHLALLDDPAAYAKAVIGFCGPLPP